MHTHFISKEHLSIDLIATILKSNAKLALSESAITAIVKCRTYLDNKMANSTKPVYGINTGFGSLCDVKINTEDLSQLQKNLVMSHACGTGEQVPQEIVRLMLLLKIQSLAYGHSGVQLKTVERLIEFYNLEIYPIIYFSIEDRL